MDIYKTAQRKKNLLTMHLKKEVDQSSPGQRDVRLRHYYIYHCDICGHEKDFDWQPHFDTIRLRKCPNCGVTNDTSNEEHLIKRKHELEQQIEQLTSELSRINLQLKETVIEKLEEYHVK